MLPERSRKRFGETPPRIALVIRDLANRSGGAERIYCELANFLAEVGLDVSCVTFDRPGVEAFYRLDPRVEWVQLGGANKSEVEVAQTIAFKLLPKGLFLRDRIRWHAKNMGFVQQLRRYLDAGRADVAISLLPPTNTVTLVAAEGRNVKVIPTNHNVPAEDYANPLRWGGGEYDRSLRLKMLDRADAIHVLFPKFGEWFPARLQDRIVAIPNYVSDEILEAAAESRQAKREKAVLAVGRLSPVKNYGALIEAWSRLGERRNGWNVKIFGHGPETKRLHQQIARLGLSDEVELCGVTRSVADEYRRAAVLCHPAQFEGFGLTVAEALSCETPVIAYNETPGVEQFLTDGYNCLLVPRVGDEIDGLASGLAKLIDDESLRHRLGKNGPASVAQFNKYTYVERWLDVIERVTSGSDHAKR